jgi:hypothetical protein
MQLVLVDHIDQVLEVALKPPKPNSVHPRRIPRKSKTKEKGVVVAGISEPNSA